MKLAYLLLSCSDVPRVTNLTQAWVFKLATHAAGYYFDMSGERELMEFRVFDWFQLPVTDLQWENWGFGAGNNVVPMVAAGLQVDLSPYDHFVLVIDKADSHGGATTPDRKFTHLAAADFDAAILCHELGHQFGSNHANLAVPGGIEYYGDSFCIMGAEGVKFSYQEPTLNFPNMVGQGNWRFCMRCSELFFDGYPSKGVCPGQPVTGGGAGSRAHRAFGSMYLLPHDVPGPGQNNWRYCSLCFCMFYDGYPTKGVCPANPAKTGHVASGYMFMLQHDVVDTGQLSWRFCEACFAMFYDGAPAKGKCPARDTGHLASGFNFTLLHDIPDHESAGPGMVASNLEACGWLDPTQEHVGRDLGAALRSRPARMDLELIALRGAATTNYAGVFPMVGWGDDLMPLRPGERFLMEYRSRDGRDKGLPPTDLGAPGFLVMHALTGSGTSSSSVRISYMPVELRGTLYVDDAAMEVNILTFDRLQGTVSVELKSDPWPPPPGQTNWRYCRKCQSMFYDGYAAKGACPVGGSHVASGYNFVLQHDAFFKVYDVQQDKWRYCDKCFALHFDGYATSGHCAVQGHVASGLNFSLRHDVNDPGQDQWRYCSKCSYMFFDGYPDKGVCPQGGGHTASGFNFNLPHDVPGDGQDQWQYCSKCHSMFYNGYPTKGVCPQGGEHLAAGYDFRLPHDVPEDNSRQQNWRFCRNCFGLFYEGFEPDGVCPASGHRARGYNFFLQHDSPGDGQAAWRFCSQCYQMFYDGYPTKGTCPVGGPHTAAGFDFRLYHR